LFRQHVIAVKSEADALRAREDLRGAMAGYDRLLGEAIGRWEKDDELAPIVREARASREAIRPVLVRMVAEDERRRLDQERERRQAEEARRRERAERERLADEIEKEREQIAREEGH